MNPQQPSYGYGPTLPAPGPGQYDFIMGHGTPGSNRFGASTSTKTRLLVALGGALLLIIIAWVFLTFLAKSSSIDTAPLVSLAQQQTELARISQAPAEKATLQPTQNFAATTHLSMTTEQQAFAGYIKKQGGKVDEQTLRALKNTKTDQTLATAQTTGTYDAVYTSIAQKQIADYQNALKQAFANAKGQNEKKLLDAAYKHAQLLLQQSKQN